MTSYEASSQAARTSLDLRLLRRVLTGTMLGFLAAAYGIGLAQFARDPAFILTAAALMAAAPFIWRRPQLGLYLIAGSAAAIETFQLRFPDSITDVIPFFRSLDSLGSPVPAPLSPGEIIVAGTIAILAVKRIAARQHPLELGPLFPPLALLSVLAALAVIRGIGAGGDVSAAIWEARAQFYLTGALLLAYNLVREPGHVKVVLWVVLGAIALKGFLGLWRFLVTLDGDLSLAGSVSPNTNALFAHEESFFFAFFLLFFFSMFLFRAAKTQRLFCLLFMVPVLLSLLANERRAGIGILAIGIVVIAMAALVYEPSRRRLLITAVVAAALVVPPYLVVFGSGDGIIAQPARAVVSLFQPDDRDLSSNTYRVIEYENVSRTIMESPIIGHGYGIPFTMYEPLPDISDSFAFWNIVPHNSLLWVWLRLGLIGVIVFWFFIGRTITASALAARHTTDPYLRSVAVLAIAVVVGWLVMGAVDMGLANVRLAVLTGVLVGIAARVPMLAKRTPAEQLITSP